MSLSQKLRTFGSVSFETASNSKNGVVVIVIRWGLIAAVIAFFVSILMGILFEVRVFHIFFRALIFSALFFGLGVGLRHLISNYFPEMLYTDDENNENELYEQSGARIAIIQDNIGEYAVPELYRTAAGSEELGNIEDLVSGAFSPSGSKGIDRNNKTGYNNEGNEKEQVETTESQNISNIFPEEIPFHGDSLGGSPGGDNPAVGSESAPSPIFSPSFGDSGGLEGLPDLDMMARAFSPGFSGSVPVFTTAQTSSPPPDSAPLNVSGQSSFLPKVEDFEPAAQQSYRGGNKPQPMEGDFNPKELAEGLRAVLAKDK